MITKTSSVPGNEVVNRIVQLAERDGKHERDVIEYLGLKRGTFANWKRGQSDSYLHYLKEISEYFHVTPNYLILGDDGFVIRPGNDLFTEDELKVIDLYRSIGIKEKNYIKILMTAIKDQEN